LRIGLVCDVIRFRRAHEATTSRDKRGENQMTKNCYLRALGMAFGIAGLALAGGQPAQAAEPFTISSSAFKDGGMLQVKNAGNIKKNPNCVGDNVSPPLAWKNAPEGTKSYAITMRDLAGRGGLGVDHWVIYGIPASVTGFAEGEASKPSDKFVGGQNLPKTGLYFGPCAPPNTTYHHYVITLIATDLDPKALKPGLTIPELLNALKGHDKGATEIVALFKHP
jgi:Raf kinase inhibitor-like YbhB/YbcL family protein